MPRRIVINYNAREKIHQLRGKGYSQLFVLVAYVGLLFGIEHCKRMTTVYVMVFFIRKIYLRRK